jgi:hypothetical protein
MRLFLHQGVQAQLNAYIRREDGGVGVVTICPRQSPRLARAILDLALSGELSGSIDDHLLNDLANLGLVFDDSASMDFPSRIIDVIGEPSSECRLGEELRGRVSIKSDERMRRFETLLLDDQSTVLWIEDATTGVVSPFIVPQKLTNEVERWMNGEDLSSDVHRVLWSGRACPCSASNTAVLERTPMSETESIFSVRQLFSASIQDAICRYLSRRFRQGLFVRGDSLVPDRDCIHNDTVMNYFHRELEPFASRLVGRTLTPTYTYTVAYSPGAQLPPHINHPPGEWTISYVVYSGPGADSWPIFVGTTPYEVPQSERRRGVRISLSPNAASRSISLETGDAVLFRGGVFAHWREPQPGNLATAICIFCFG